MQLDSDVLVGGPVAPLRAGFKDENGVLPRDAIRKQFNGSLFYEYAAKMGKSMKEKKVRLQLHAPMTGCALPSFTCMPSAPCLSA
jgi:hypothetical protein